MEKKPNLQMEGVIAVLGEGGREHALCWKLSQSPRVKEIYAIPGNAGTAKCPKVKNVKVNTSEFTVFYAWIKNTNVSLVVVGPEVLLEKGYANMLISNGIKCFGPTSEAASIESDKEWGKTFMDKYGIPTAQWKSFEDAANAEEFIRSVPFGGSAVIKASGLAGGKGVRVTYDIDESLEAIDSILTKKRFGSAGAVIVIEECLQGEEVSVLAFADGCTVKIMPPVQDHKRINDNDEGPNTGGMGAYCPFILTDEEKLFIEENIMKKTILGLSEELTPFVGVLYAGLMITEQGIKVLEFNCRFGDPETQVLMPLLDSDLYEIITACLNMSLEEIEIKWKNNQSCVGVVISCEGYPDLPPTPTEVSEIFHDEPDVIVFHGNTKLDADNESIIASGGRAFSVVAVDDNLVKASVRATLSCSGIKFRGAHYRRDIGHKGIVRYLLHSGKTTYQSAGVNIAAGNELIKTMRAQIESTYGESKISPIGSYGAIMDVKLMNYVDPRLVSGCDGVGTKLKIAQETGNHKTIGQDLVAMCVNDLLAHGAKPLFFLDYFSCGKLESHIAETVITSITDGCKLAECALVGGETAEMPGFYKDDEYDLAGFAVGIVEKELLMPTSISPDDKVIYLPSSGFHSNGFSLVRKVIKDQFIDFNAVAPFSSVGSSYGQEFLKPTKIYTKEILPLVESKLIKAFAHITGGGLLENIGRVLPNHLKVDLDASLWNILPEFGWIAVAGSIGEEEMLRTFNCGVGGVVIVDPTNADNVEKILNSKVIGTVVPRDEKEPQVKIRNFTSSLGKIMNKFVPLYLSPAYTHYKRVAVLISGIGSNLKALIESTISDPHSPARIVLVISNKENAGGLAIADEYGIKNKVIQKRKSVTREEFDKMTVDTLVKEKIDIVCLAGYMHILSTSFVEKYRGRMLNIHPSLLPAFKGINAQLQAIEAGVTVSGCTVHFVEPAVDSGSIIEQCVVPVYPKDNEESLTLRIKEREHEVFPRALKMLAAGKIALDKETGKVLRY